MSCSICGRGSCCKSFHSLEEQENYDEIADKVTDNLRGKVINIVGYTEGYYDDADRFVVYYDELIKNIESNI